MITIDRHDFWEKALERVNFDVLDREGTGYGGYFWVPASTKVKRAAMDSSGLRIIAEDVLKIGPAAKGKGITTVYTLRTFFTHVAGLVLQDKEHRDSLYCDTLEQVNLEGTGLVFCRSWYLDPAEYRKYLSTLTDEVNASLKRHDLKPILPYPTRVS